MGRILGLGLAGLALVVSAWFALGWVQARDTGKATALLAGPQAPAPEAISQTRSLLDTAGTLNPDRTVDLQRARLAVYRHDYTGAIGVLESVTRSEPQNVLAWTELGVVGGLTHNQHLVRVAGGHIATLVPNIG
jgi:hypothetical protein